VRRSKSARSGWFGCSPSSNLVGCLLTKDTSSSLNDNDLHFSSFFVMSVKILARAQLFSCPRLKFMLHLILPDFILITPTLLILILIILLSWSRINVYHVSPWGGLVKIRSWHFFELFKKVKSLCCEFTCSRFHLQKWLFLSYPFERDAIKKNIGAIQSHSIP